MKQKILGLLIAVIFLSASTLAHATGEELVEGMGQKALRGAINTFTGWWEIPAQVMKGWDRGFGGDTDNKLGGALVGIFTGFSHAAGRTFSGVSDLVGFWAASPTDNDGIGIPLDAEYAWEEGEQYNMFDPDFAEAGIAPMGRKLVRGLGNGVLGFVELPGQIVKGIKEKAPDLGIIKGLWYACSRTIDGAGDVATFFVPNPADTKGMAFDEEWPWDALVENMQ